MPRQSTRPVVEQLDQISIGELKRMEMLEDEGAEVAISSQFAVRTSLKTKRPFCQITYHKNETKILLVSRKLGRALLWFFREPSSGQSCTRLFFFDGQWRSRETIGAVYQSQYDEKVLRCLLRMGDLAVAICGDPVDGKGPGRGRRKRINIQQLRNDIDAIVSNQDQLEKVLEDRPELYRVPTFAINSLRTELLNLPIEWRRFERKYNESIPDRVARWRASMDDH